MRPRFLVLITALLCGAVLASSAGAAEPAPVEASFALKPVMYDPALTATKSYFILALKPGALIKDQVRIVNTGGKIGTAFLYPVDATTGQTSGAVYLSRQSPRRDVASWVVLSRSRVTLAPGADAVVPFTVRVPKSARPGDHLGGIVAENSQIQKSSNRGALQIKIRHLTIAAVEAQLPGAPVATVAATGVKAGGEHGYQYVYVHMKSTGNVLIKPAATLTVRNAKGRVVARRQMQLDTFVPGTEIDYPALLPRQALKARPLHGGGPPFVQQEPRARLPQGAACAVRRHSYVPVHGHIGRADEGLLGCGPGHAASAGRGAEELEAQLRAGRRWRA